MDQRVATRFCSMDDVLVDFSLWLLSFAESWFGLPFAAQSAITPSCNDHESAENFYTPRKKGSVDDLDALAESDVDTNTKYFHGPEFEDARDVSSRASMYGDSAECWPNKCFYRNSPRGRSILAVSLDPTWCDEHETWELT